MNELTDQSKNYKKFQLDIKDFKIIKQLQSGGFGLIYSVENIKTKNIYAAKVMNAHCDEVQYAKMINREIEIMIRCQHPTIIKFIGYSFIDFINQKNVTIFMDLAKNGSLADLLQKAQKGLLDEMYDNTKKQIILVGIARGMMFLHQHHIIHRDLKPGNILIDNNYHPLITDFGLSKVNNSNYSISQSQQCGTSMYMAPEIIEGNKYNGKVDVYSFGILMYEVVTNSIPYPLLINGKMSAYSFNKKVVDEDYRPKFDFQINKSIQKLIEKCWAKDPKERPTFENIFKKLAYNLDISTNDVYDDNENFDDEIEQNNFYFDDVDVDEVISYANDIDVLNKPVKYEKKIESNQFNELIEKAVNTLKQENEDMKNKILIIQKERETEKKSFLNDIQLLKEKVEQEKKDHSIEIEKLKKDYEGKFEAMNKKMQQILAKFDEAVQQKGEKDEIQKVISYFNENSSYDIFNNLKGEFQTKIILGLLNENKIIQNISKLLNFLSEEQIKASFKFDEIEYIYIQAKDPQAKFFNTNDDIEKVFITIESFEMLIKNNSIDSTQLIDILNNFDDIYVQFNYPSDEYQKLFNEIKKFTQYKLKIDVNVSKIDENDKSFQNNKFINSININPSINVITGGFQNGFFELCSLIEINIPESVTLICGGAFNECINLKEINIPSSIKKIEGSAFNNCSSLTELVIPPTVEYIGELGFANCVNLQKIMIDPYKTKIEKNTFDKCLLLDHLIFSSSVNCIEKFDFDLFWKLTKITIPDSVTSINSNSLSCCSLLKKIIIPSSVASIENNYFNNCVSLTEIIIPSSVTSIGNDVFNDCKSLLKMTFPSSITSIGNNSFNNCEELTEIMIPSSVTSIGNNSFNNCTSLTEIMIPSSVTSIGNDVFNDCKSLLKITFPSSITSIGSNSFNNCEALADIILPESVKTIGSNSFKNCISLSEKNIPPLIKKFLRNSNDNYIKADKTEELFINGSLKSPEFKKILNSSSNTVIELKYPSYNFSEIYKIVVDLKKVYNSKIKISIFYITGIESTNKKFRYDKNIDIVELPSSVTSIGDGSFKGCGSLKEVIIPDSVRYIGDYAFGDCTSLKQITIPKSVNKIGEYVFEGCSELINVSIQAPITTLGYGIFSKCCSLTKLEIPSSVVEINGYAFSKCSKIKDIALPPSLKNIKYSSFYSCKSVEKIIIPSSVDVIEDFCFEGCSSLVEITIPLSVTKIGNSVFKDCKSLKNIDLPNSLASLGNNAFSGCSSLENIKIPSSITSIEYGTFRFCSSLSDVSLPSTLISIKDYAFHECKSLKKIEIPATIQNIAKSSFPSQTTVIKV